MTYRVGLTGGIGSGKSTVSSIFAELNVPVIDTDIISHQLTQPEGAAIPIIQSTFGNEYINAEGALDRARMRKLVFSDTSAKQKLENILHPYILAQARKLAESSLAPYILIVVPLLFESSDYVDWLDRTLTIDCPEETQITRATARAGLDEPTVRAIMARQMSRSERIQRADDVINNDGSLDKLSRQIAQLHHSYLNLAKRSN